MEGERPTSRFQYIVVFLLLVFLVSCKVPRIPTPVSSAPMPSPVPPTINPSPTHTFVSSTLTPAATLTADERQTLLKEMLQTNGGCALPCWWGITPGQTDWQTVRNQFIGYGGFVFEMPHPARPFDYSVDLAFDQKDGVVRFINVRGGVFTGATSEHFARDWRRYSLDQVLIRYGEPSQVMLQLTPPMEAGSPAGYALDIYYDELGIAVRYLALATYEEMMIRACPVFDHITGIDLWLQSPEEEASLVGRAIAPDEMAYFRPLEEATGMSLETFYDTFSNPDIQVCLEGLPTLP